MIRTVQTQWQPNKVYIAAPEDKALQAHVESLNDVHEKTKEDLKNAEHALQNQKEQVRCNFILIDYTLICLA